VLRLSEECLARGLGGEHPGFAFDAERALHPAGASNHSTTDSDR
jgi:hypothetical protein